MLRRSFLSRFAAAPAFFGFGGQSQPAAKPPVATEPVAAPAKPPTGRFEAARHAQDDWFEQLPGSHRVVFDTWTAGKFREATGFAGNYFRANQDYGLTDKDLAVVIVARHQTAPFAFNEAMWTKYGKYFAERTSVTDPKTSDNPNVNIHATSLSNLVKRGMHLAVCNLTTRAYTRILADATGTSAEDIYKELTTNTLGNAHFMAAGVLAVSRAQERGYTLVSVG